MKGGLQSKNSGQPTAITETTKSETGKPVTGQFKTKTAKAKPKNQNSNAASLNLVSFARKWSKVD